MILHCSSYHDFLSQTLLPCPALYHRQLIDVALSMGVLEAHSTIGLTNDLSHFPFTGPGHSGRVLFRKLRLVVARTFFVKLSTCLFYESSELIVVPRYFD